MSTAVWDIFTKFGVPVAMDSPQRAVTSFWGYNKNPRWRPAAILNNGKSQ